MLTRAFRLELETRRLELREIEIGKIARQKFLGGGVALEAGSFPLHCPLHGYRSSSRACGWTNCISVSVSRHYRAVTPGEH
jgi:hypothetical protein